MGNCGSSVCVCVCALGCVVMVGGRGLQGSACSGSWDLPLLSRRRPVTSLASPLAADRHASCDGCRKLVM